ncbi:S9 family peptidase [Hyunsoonleella sp. SJ7]|uniref:S9 family peptidase n=1 Tax=Hyunsoonleella aquatilis TaxID=2762758 RepID=A0A923H9W9_9FLAO|nr:S9 family peptidase [Hyunsoonleella aquatilis]MBC3757139.1 S9 family peptidase [Hyunsoonleella aquatilis]
MKYLKISLLICLFLSFSFNAQTKNITLEEIWSGAFSTESMDVLHSMKDGKQYSVFNFERSIPATMVDIYDYKTLKKVKTLVSSADIPEINYFTDYTFSNDESKLLLVTEEEQIYRHSSKGIYFVYDISTKSVQKVSEEKIQEPTFSPDGTKVAFALNNNLYVKDLNSGETKQITFDGETNKIINGITDWVYEEEFSYYSALKTFPFVRAFEWNSAGDKIAFIKFDETDVPEFSMDIYGKTLYPNQQVFKYPKAGEANSKVSLHIYDLGDEKTEDVKVDKHYKDFYIPRMKWANNPDILSIQFMNRRQNELDLWFVNVKENRPTLVLKERDEAYVDITYNVTFLKDDSFIWTSEKDGYNHIYHYSKSGDLINQITKGNWEVTAYYGYNPKANLVYYQSTENGSINRDVYSIKLNGRHKKQLTQKEGNNDADFNADFSYFINKFSNASTPPEYTLNSASNGNLLKDILDNDQLSKKWSTYQTSKKEYSTINVNGNDLNMWMLKPADFDASKEYPLLMFQYSGPGSQRVVNSWHGYNDYWFQFLVQKGYVMVCVDGRGTGFKGADFKKVTQNNLGKFEVEDQIQAARQLADLPYIDKDRIGIWGWSFGGFTSANALFKANDVFKMAIAVAPVASWRFYDSIYTERYLGKPQDNPEGYDDNSPISYVSKLKGDFLLVHGSGDDNVHVQNTMRLVEALVQANKKFDWAIYPDKNHGIYGGNTRLHLFQKMTDFIDETLGNKTEE